jgi:hypothetical protein
MQLSCRRQTLLSDHGKQGINQNFAEMQIMTLPTSLT